MKKRNLLILGLVITIVLIITTLLIINKDKNNDNIQQNIQSINLEEEKLGKTIIDNDLIIESSNVECNETFCTITMVAKNQTTDSIDMSDYRISFMDSNNQEIYWYSGNSIGKVEAGTEQLFSLEVPKSITRAEKIVYTKD